MTHTIKRAFGFVPFSVPSVLLALALCPLSVPALTGDPPQLSAGQPSVLEIFTTQPKFRTIDPVVEVPVLSSADVTVNAVGVSLQDDDSFADLHIAVQLRDKAVKVPGNHSPQNIPLMIDTAKLKNVASASGKLVLFYSSDKGAIGHTASVAFTIAAPVPDVGITVRPLNVIRYLPFGSQTLHDGESCLRYFSTPHALAPIGLSVDGDVYTATSDTARPQNAALTAIFHSDQVCFETTIPGQFTEWKARISPRPPQVRKPLDFDIDMRIKDWWMWRAIATTLATVPALIFVYWTTVVRRRLMNRIQRESISARLARFLSANPRQADSDSVVFVRQLLLDSITEEREGDFASAAATLTAAGSRVDALTAPQPIPAPAVPTPPAAPAPAGAAPAQPAAPAVPAPAAPIIRIVNPPYQLFTGHKVRFTVIDPSIVARTGAVFNWSITSGATSLFPASGVDLTRFVVRFSVAGLYTVHLKVDGLVYDRDINVLDAPPRSIIEKFRIAQLAAFLVAGFIAIGTAYIMTENAVTWGTVGDYFNLIVASFGLSGSAGGITNILTAIRGPA